MPFDEVMEAALYHPELGFYCRGGQAGRRGDFVTSVEVGPLFGAVVARALDGWWREMGRPDPFLVAEAGAGRGMLARTVLAAEPECGPALRYLMVERSVPLRAAQAEHLDIARPEQVLGPVALDDDGLPKPLATGVGPVVASLAELPSVDGPVVVLANELLDNLPFRLIERGPDGWCEVRVGLDRQGALAEVVVALPPSLTVPLSAEGVARGARLPVQATALAWLRSALVLAGEGGRVVAFDYTATSSELAQRPWTDWLRTYAGHERGVLPLENLGHQDITADVCVDQLARIRRPTVTPQADWLRDHGLDDLVAEGRQVWEERAHLGDLEAIKARSRITEAEALCDPSGLGAFGVMEWTT